MRKTRSDAVLMNLPEEQQAKLADWLLSGVPYHEAKVLVEKEFGVTVRSLNTFGVFWREVCAPALLARRRRAVTTAEQRAEEADKTPGRFDQATLDAIKQRAFELSENPNSNPKDVKAVLMLVLKARDQDIKQQDIELRISKYRDQVAERKRALEREINAAKSTGGISPETFERVERELKLL
jgi:hypothetical protein